MATLEVHDDRGNVRRVAISRDHPALFGSSAECDIVLQAPGILPVHGRIRWKGGRYKVDASPDAQAIERNGQKVTTASFRIGDEVRVGPYRIFMINPDTGPLDEKTRLLAQPQGKAAGAPAAASKFESLGWMKSLDVAPPSVETPGGADPQADPGTAAYDKAYQDAVARRAGQATQQAAVQRQTLLGRVRSLMVGGEQRPGQERILTSPVVLGLVAAFVVLVVVLISLRSVIGDKSATYAFNRAVQTHDDGDYRNAIVQFDEFLESNPKDSRASKAKVLRYLSSAEQYVRSGMPSWT
ncbi:MAG TPA: FHA domain-containing protein, partial [Isosphaeraceae bacterium]|nr:FHA domain-containing protein [Isosphaeraceae bacterium]